VMAARGFCGVRDPMRVTERSWIPLRSDRELLPIDTEQWDKFTPTHHYPPKGKGVRERVVGPLPVIALTTVDIQNFPIFTDVPIFRMRFAHAVVNRG
jgi:hypothetical protein